MKIIVVATGTIGKAVVEALSDRHEVIAASRSSSDYPVDVLDQSSIKTLLESVAPFDVLISATGQARFKPLNDLSDEDFQFSLANKLPAATVAKAYLKAIEEPITGQVLDARSV